MKVRISFRAEITIEGESIEEIKRKYENTNLFASDNIEFIETQYAERIDDESYEEISLR